MIRSFFNRRSKLERRKVKHSRTFPLINRKGEVVFDNRRNVPDRRVGGLELIEDSISQVEFREYFTQITAKKSVAK